MGRINAGSLNQRIVLLTTAASVPVGGGQGFAPAGPDTELPLWARVRPLRAAEVLALGQTLNTAAFEITIRKRDGVSAKQRVRYQGHELNVQGMVADEFNEYLLLTCFSSGKQ